jgi:hypothetical protein
MFIKYAVGRDPSLVPFFRDRWLQVVATSKIPGRKHKPPYSTARNRRTFNALIFDALGSTMNPTDFVLCEAEINSMKEHLWHNVDPMELGKYRLAVKEAMTGAVHSQEYLSALRTVCVFQLRFEDKFNEFRHWQSSAT